MEAESEELRRFSSDQLLSANPEELMHENRKAFLEALPDPKLGESREFEKGDREDMLGRVQRRQEVSEDGASAFSAAARVGPEDWIEKVTIFCFSEYTSRR